MRSARGNSGLPTHGWSAGQRAEALKVKRIQQCVLCCIVTAAVLPMGLYAFHRSRTAGIAPVHSLDDLSSSRELFDAIVVPGGGLTSDGDAPEWVRERLNAALSLYETNAHAQFVLLSRGTPHKPPPVDLDGRPIDEATVSAEYLRERGVPATRLFQDTWSLDTIGNAVFLRIMHLEPRRLKRVAIITNKFHMGRVRTIFEWVLKANPRVVPFVTTYVEVPDVGLTPEQLAARVQKEAASLAKLQETTMQNFVTVDQIHAFVFEHHGAYATGIPRAPVSKELAASY
mmetsp:Transcript_5097/g.14821  ORF Transcript_5097/g.14821 Transcript_5097/m.14821 type:complete len:286 (-) Transcript_5097:141-998(-)